MDASMAASAKVFGNAPRKQAESNMEKSFPPRRKNLYRQAAPIRIKPMSLPDGFSPPASATTAPKPLWPQRLLLVLTLVAGIASLFVPARQSAPVDAFALVLAAAASVAVLARTLPLQSVLFAAFITMLIGGAAHALSARTGLPFGPLSFGEQSGPQLFNCVPWTVPFFWVVAIFNSRGVVRLILRPWRKVKNYGFLLMAFTALLALAFDFALEPFARAKHLWLWHPTKISITWHSASPLVFLGWIFVTGIILAVIMPYLIRKQPGSPSTPDFAPLALWLGAIGLFGVNAAQAGLWSAVMLDGIIAVTISVLCWRGAKW
jgi:uncharacterized membrane protein